MSERPYAADTKLIEWLDSLEENGEDLPPGVKRFSGPGNNWIIPDEVYEMWLSQYD